ncbi:MAG: DUF2147 domain-containing protein [Bacteroidia bacterium]|nr:DUF2147 domain-containing protein [Bacteroidia bacterium]
MKYLIATFISLFLSLATFAQSPSGENAVKGIWAATEMNNSQIEIYKAQDGLWYGKILKSDDAKTIGKLIFREGKYDATSKKWVGKLIKPDNGMTLTAELSLEPNDKLKVKGSKYFMTKTFYWAKLK